MTLYRIEDLISYIDANVKWFGHQNTSISVIQKKIIRIFDITISNRALYETHSLYHYSLLANVMNLYNICEANNRDNLLETFLKSFQKSYWKLPTSGESLYTSYHKFQTLNLRIPYYDSENETTTRSVFYLSNLAQWIKKQFIFLNRLPMDDNERLELAPHLTSIYISEESEISIGRLLENTERVDSLFITHCKITGSCLKKMKHPEHVKLLFIENCRKFNANVPESYTHLEYFSVSNCDSYNRMPPCHISPIQCIKIWDCEHFDFFHHAIKEPLLFVNFKPVSEIQKLWNKLNLKEKRIKKQSIIENSNGIRNLVQRNPKNLKKLMDLLNLYCEEVLEHYPEYHRFLKIFSLIETSGNDFVEKFYRLKDETDYYDYLLILLNHFIKYSFYIINSPRCKEFLKDIERMNVPINLDNEGQFFLFPFLSPEQIHEVFHALPKPKRYFWIDECISIEWYKDSNHILELLRQIEKDFSKKSNSEENLKRDLATILQPIPSHTLGLLAIDDPMTVLRFFPYLTALQRMAVTPQFETDLFVKYLSHWDKVTHPWFLTYATNEQKLAMLKEI